MSRIAVANPGQTYNCLWEINEKHTSDVKSFMVLLSYTYRWSRLTHDGQSERAKTKIMLSFGYFVSILFS